MGQTKCLTCGSGMSLTKRGETGDVGVDWAEREEVGRAVEEKDGTGQEREKQAKSVA